MTESSYRRNKSFVNLPACRHIIFMALSLHYAAKVIFIKIFFLSSPRPLIVQLNKHNLQIRHYFLDVTVQRGEQIEFICCISCGGVRESEIGQINGTQQWEHRIAHLINGDSTRNDFRINLHCCFTKFGAIKGED